jgi:hypothetical protein
MQDYEFKRSTIERLKPAEVVWTNLAAGALHAISHKDIPVEAMDKVMELAAQGPVKQSKAKAVVLQFKPKVVNDPNHKEPEDMPQVRWEKESYGIAAEALAMRADWMKRFPNWDTFPVSSEQADMFERAAAEWKTMAESFRSRVSSS